MREYSTSWKSNENVVFNSILGSARNAVECAFGWFKARWQVLTKKKKMNFKLEKIPTMIAAHKGQQRLLSACVRKYIDGISENLKGLSPY